MKNVLLFIAASIVLMSCNGELNNSNSECIDCTVNKSSGIFTIQKLNLADIGREDLINEIPENYSNKFKIAAHTINKVSVASMKYESFPNDLVVVIESILDNNDLNSNSSNEKQVLLSIHNLDAKSYTSKSSLYGISKFHDFNNLDEFEFSLFDSDDNLLQSIIVNNLGLTKQTDTPISNFIKNDNNMLISGDYFDCLDNCYDTTLKEMKSGDDGRLIKYICEILETGCKLVTLTACAIYCTKEFFD